MTLQLIAKCVVLYTIMFAQNIGLFVKLIYFILIFFLFKIRQEMAKAHRSEWLIFALKGIFSNIEKKCLHFKKKVLNFH